jgi:4-amino-4-deoxy-L-arabinose transferase-like glycosyltransferase
MKSLINLRASKYTLIGLIAVFLVAMAIIIYATPFGLGLGFDSVAYISAARNLKSGVGLGRITCVGFKPMTLWPPFYPITLAGLGLLGLDPIRSSRAISVAGYALTIFVAALLIYRISRKILPLVLISVLFLSSASIVNTFSWAMSEALYIPISLVSLYLLYEYMENGRRAYLIGSAIFIGLAMVTRYVGIALLPVWLIILAVSENASVREKIKNGLIGLVLAGFPLLAWFIRNDIVSNSGTGRKLSLNIPSLLDLEYFIKQVVSWVIPVEYTRYRIRLIIIAVSFLALIIMTIFFLFSPKLKSSAVRKGILLFLLYSLFYSLVVLGTIIFWVPSISMVDERILVPLLVNLLILVALAGIYVWETEHRTFEVLFGLICLYMFIYYSPQQIKTINELHSDGQGYASRVWQDSPAIDDLKNIQSVVYTNDFQALYFLSGQNGCILPTNENDLDVMRENIFGKKGYVVVFGSHLPEFLPIEEITQGMTLLKEYPDIKIFQQLDTQK